MMRCADIEADLVPHGQGELDVLREARVDAHLLHCERCRDASRSLEGALRAGRAWSPSVTDAEVERLSAGLVGLVPAPRATRTRTLAVGLAMAASTLLALHLMAPRGESVATVALEPAIEAEPGHEPAVVPVSRPMTVQQLEPPTQVERVRRARLAPTLRAVTSEDWDGSVVSSPTQIDVVATRGFAVMALDAGPRTLRVRTDDVEFEVGGARLFVEVAPGQPTRVGVLAGRVEIVRDGRRTRVEAGEVIAADAAPPGEVRSRRYHGDPFLVGPTARMASPRTPAAAPRPRPVLDVLELVAEAEDLARIGRGRAAEALLRHGAATAEDARTRALLRFEVARLISRDEARRAEAVELLDAVAAERRGEPSVQAAILRCELELDRDRCAARRCLEAIAPETPEAARVLQRSRLTHEPCGS